MIEASGLSKAYGSAYAVRDLSFQVRRGSVTALLGLNGAGKSTTLKMLAGALGPTEGSISVGGYDLLRQPLAARHAIGYLAENAPLYAEMTPASYLRYRAQLKGIPARHRREAVRDACHLANCQEHALEERISTLSRGTRQRVGFADALLGRPAALILDEPTAGFDPEQLAQFHVSIAALKGDHAIILSTHALSEVDGLCSDVLVIQHGQLIMDGPIDALKAGRNGSSRVSMDLRDSQGRAEQIFNELNWSICSESSEGSPSGLARRGESVLMAVVIEHRASTSMEFEDEIERLVSRLTAAGVGVRSIARLPNSLATAFSNLITENHEQLPLR